MWMFSCDRVELLRCCCMTSFFVDFTELQYKYKTLLCQWQRKIIQLIWRINIKMQAFSGKFDPDASQSQLRNYTFHALIHLQRTRRKWSWRKRRLPSAPPLKIRGPIDPLIRLARCHADTQENTTSETDENWPGPLVFTLQQEAAAAYICPLRAWGRIISLQRWRDRCRVNWQLLHRWVLGKRFFFLFFLQQWNKRRWKWQCGRCLWRTQSVLAPVVVTFCLLPTT